MFSSISEFLEKELFTDVKVCCGLDIKFVRCHALILMAAIPSIKEILIEVSKVEEEVLTIILPEDSFESINAIISDIYLALKQEVSLTTNVLYTNKSL